MDRRIHEVLDGERARAELTPRERARLEDYERAVEGALAPLGRERVPDLTDAVMARVEELEERASRRREGVDRPLEVLRRAWRWLWRPRTVTVRPILAGAGLAALAAAMVLAPVSRPVFQESPVATATADGSETTVMVQFRFDVQDVGTVQLAGDFTGWEPAYDMHEVAPGVWSVVVPLPPGIHDYAFVVDGRHWRPDPLAPAVDDGFGGTNSRLALLAPEPGGAS